MCCAAVAPPCIPSKHLFQGVLPGITPFWSFASRKKQNWEPPKTPQNPIWDPFEPLCATCALRVALTSPARIQGTLCWNGCCTKQHEALCYPVLPTVTPYSRGVWDLRDSSRITPLWEHLRGPGMVYVYRTLRNVHFVTPKKARRILQAFSGLRSWVPVDA